MRKAEQIELIDARKVVSVKGTQSDALLYTQPAYTVYGQFIDRLADALGYVVKANDFHIHFGEAPWEDECDVLEAEPQAGGVLAFRQGWKDDDGKLSFWERTYHGVYVVTWADEP